MVGREVGLALPKGIPIEYPCHPRVRAVAYPGLPTSEDHQVAATSLVSGFGPYVDYATGTEEMCWHRIDASGHEGVPLVERLERELIR